MLPQLAVAPAAGPAVRAQLRAEQGPLAGQTFAISHSPFALGRSPENDLVLPEPLASRHHARLELRAGRWYVIDLDSANGTLLNHQRLSGEMTLNAGDLIAIGDTMFAFDAAPAPAAAAPPAPRGRPASARLSPLAAIVIGVVVIALLTTVLIFVAGRMRRTADDASGPALPTVQLPVLPSVTLPTGIPSLPPLATALPPALTQLPPIPTGLPSLPTFPPLR